MGCINHKLVDISRLENNHRDALFVPVGAAIFKLSVKERPLVEIDGRKYAMHQMGRRRWDVMTADWRASIDEDPVTDSLVLEFRDDRVLPSVADYVAQETLTVTGTNQFGEGVTEKYYASLEDLTGVTSYMTGYKPPNKKVLLL